MLLFEMSSPVILASKASKPAPSSGGTANVRTEVTIGYVAFLVAEKIFRKREGNVLGSARRYGAFK
jgi:hypothetical protein